jgi:hypothetical protein
VRARVFFAPPANGLGLPWFGRLWCNFPYGSHIAAWVEKLRAEYERGSVSEAVALVPARTDARWFGRLDPFPQCFVRGRLRFNGAGTTPFPSVVADLGCNVDGFIAAYRPFGRIVRAL